MPCSHVAIFLRRRPATAFACLQVEDEAVEAGLAACHAPRDACSADDLVRLLAVMAAVGGHQLQRDDTHPGGPSICECLLGMHAFAMPTAYGICHM